MADIKSPCNSICTVDQVSKLCIGCGRTLAEIAAWSQFTADERARIMTELPRRLSRLRGTGPVAADIT
jgi:predicted Fe-S protein YdhL (DUF1289 family)